MLLAALLLSPVPPGCGKSKSEETSPKTEEVTEKGKSWGGWRYRGKREDCFFRLGRRCFSSLDDACKAAKCGPKKKCVHDDAAPAKVSCEEK